MVITEGERVRREPHDGKSLLHAKGSLSMYTQGVSFDILAVSTFRVGYSLTDSRV